MGEYRFFSFTENPMYYHLTANAGRFVFTTPDEDLVAAFANQDNMLEALAALQVQFDRRLQNEKAQTTPKPKGVLDWYPES